MDKDNMKHRRLQELDRSDFAIVDGEPDIRGWDVKNMQGKKIGEVEELIVDAQNKKVRYMVVDLDDNELDLDHHKVLIPIGLAQLHKEHDDVILNNVQPEQLRALPDYDEDKLNPTVEAQICSVLGRRNYETPNTTNNTQQQNDEFYKHDYFNDDNLYKDRLHQLKSQDKESDYERGLRLWERRSEGGLLDDDNNRRTNTGGREDSYEKEREERMEMVRNRRMSYEQQRNNDVSGRGSDRTENII